ncbi:MAG: PfkB family carbohydrate kinase [Candidatus Omnitrophica bacterium]|nr:PfkB family carbohydrate kinase [Candidatus Omnitrophota bacterium]MDD5429246.1 PfkB family carbohydrate kinase [Candidatus Omnitrophota bacterium]
MSVLVVGSVALDTIKTPLGSVKDALGGSATYSSVSASFFGSVRLVAVIGKDFPSEHINLLEKKRIDTKGLVIENGKTFRWQGEYGWDLSNPRTIATHLNVFAEFDPKLPKDYRDSKFVFLANIDPDIQDRVLRQVARPKLVACDTMNYWIDNKRKALLKLLPKIDVFLINESEARELTGETNLLLAGRKVLKLGPKNVIVKKGEHGVLLFTNKGIFSTPAFILESVFDPTGAGDTFAGGFMGYLAKLGKCDQASLRKAIVYGCVMATFAVEDFSLRKLSSINFGSIKKRLRQYKKLTTF